MKRLPSANPAQLPRKLYFQNADWFSTFRHIFRDTIDLRLSMFKAHKQEIESESLQALEIALGEFLAKNPPGHGGRRQEIESVSLAFSAVLKQIPDGVCASVGVVQALLAFIESQRHSKRYFAKAGPR